MDNPPFGDTRCENEQSSLHIGKLLLAISETLDLISPELHLHQQRAAYIAWRLSEALGTPPQLGAEFFTAALLHDIGAMTSEAKLALLDFEAHNTDQHSELGAVLFNQVSWLKPMAEIVREHHTPWKTWESTEPGTPTILGAQILLASDVIERLLQRSKFDMTHLEEIERGLSRMSGELLSPRVVQALLEVSKMPSFWEELTSPVISQVLRHSDVFDHLIIREACLEEFSDLLRGLIDFRSPFTAAHSAGVAVCASLLGTEMGLTKNEINLMHLTGNMHDVGKLAVPTPIVEKHGRLTPGEYEIMRRHAWYSYQILGTIEGFEEARLWAGYHHERLDGSGYPFQLSGEQIPLGARIMAAADIYTALTETRPYRRGISADRAAAHLKQHVFNGQLDANVVNALLQSYAGISTQVEQTQAASYANYEATIKPYL